MQMCNNQARTFRIFTCFKPCNFKFSYSQFYKCALLNGRNTIIFYKLVQATLKLLVD